MSLMDQVRFNVAARDSKAQAQSKRAWNEELDERVQYMAHELISRGLQPNLSALRNVARRLMLAGR